MKQSPFQITTEKYRMKNTGVSIYHFDRIISIRIEKYVDKGSIPGSL